MLGFKIEKCYFNNEKCLKNFQLVQVFRDNYHKYEECFSFNSKNSSEFLLSQKSSRNSYDGLVVDLSPTDGSLKNNFLIYINDNYDRPLYNAPDQIVEKGKLGKITLDKIVQNKLGYPYSNCYRDDEMIQIKEIEQTLGFNYNKYNEKICFLFCIHNKLGELYNCSFPNLYVRKEYPIDCDTIFSKFQKLSDSYYELCFKTCMPACDSIKYTSHLQVFDKTKYVTTTTIEIRFIDMVYYYMKQYPKDTSGDLVSKIGGLLGK